MIRRPVTKVEKRLARASFRVLRAVSRRKYWSHGWTRAREKYLGLFMSEPTAFPILNHSSYLFCSSEIAKLAQYVTRRTTDTILRAEISQGEVYCFTAFGVHTFDLSEIFNTP